LKASFAAKYARTRKILTKRLKVYLKDSNPENVRSLRIAMRRTRLCIVQSECKGQRYRHYPLKDINIQT